MVCFLSKEEVELEGWSLERRVLAQKNIISYEIPTRKSGLLPPNVEMFLGDSWSLVVPCETAALGLYDSAKKGIACACSEPNK